MSRTFESYCNEPAFPESVAVDSSPEGEIYRSDNKGITRLEYFTALAMQSLISGVDIAWSHAHEERMKQVGQSVSIAKRVLKNLYEAE